MTDRLLSILEGLVETTVGKGWTSDEKVAQAAKDIEAWVNEIIGEDEDIDPLKTEVMVSLEAFAHNQLRAEQRQRLTNQSERGER